MQFKISEIKFEYTNTWVNAKLSWPRLHSIIIETQFLT